MKTPNPNEPCWCGSDTRYKNCHMRIDSFPREKRLFGAREAYAEKWEKSAASLEQQGGYDWMAGLLDRFEPRSILDIGCGTGNGIAALSKRFPKARIISVDENPEVIRKAKHRLEALGIRVNIIRRLKDKATSDRSHTLIVERGRLRVTPGVNLIECDVLEDPEIDPFLKSQRKFDVVTVWLIGSHLLRYHECDALRGTINSPNEYRLHVQSVAFVLAALFLRFGGALQIVDRGANPDTAEAEEGLLAMPRMLASETRGMMEIKELKHRSYIEADPDSAVRMIDNSGNTVVPGNLALISMIAVKQTKLTRGPSDAV